MSRQHPWRADHPDAVIVARPSRWGNPYKVRRCDNDSDSWAVVEPNGYAAGIDVDYADTKAEATKTAVDYFRHERQHASYPSDTEIRAELGGKDLACWCALPIPGEPDICHAAVLIDIANAGAS